MTAKELIKILKKMPKNATVVMWGEDNSEGNDLYEASIAYDEDYNEVTINYD
ncbi:hypothetical protein [Bacillus cereus]|uniref:hypothetical protein n=1 Tax=Bacillus cereus TaxID=1396 RepID=UPI0015D4AEF0|nr:hypothetical protein [Bacillus cereus]